LVLRSGNQFLPVRAMSIVITMKYRFARACERAIIATKDSAQFEPRPGPERIRDKPRTGDAVAEQEENAPGATPNEALLNMAVEGWRFGRLFARMLAKMDIADAPRYANQLRYFLKKVDENLATAGLRLVSLEGHPFDPGMAASALNLGDFGPDDKLIVEQMLEPIVMGSDGLVRSGTVLLAKMDTPL